MQLFPRPSAHLPSPLDGLRARVPLLSSRGRTSLLFVSSGLPRERTPSLAVSTNASSALKRRVVMLARTLLLSGLWLTRVSSQGTREYCPSMVNVEIQECVQPVADYAKLLNKPEVGNLKELILRTLLPLHPPPPPTTSAPSSCLRWDDSLIGRFEECVSEWRKKCPRHVTISLIDSSYGFLCNEGYNTFMDSAECLMDLDRKPQVKSCHDETLAEIERANSDLGVGLQAKMDRMCGALNFFSGCVRPPIRTDCGASAWQASLLPSLLTSQVIFRVLKDTTNTLMPGCQFTGTSPKLKKLFPPTSAPRSFVVTTPSPPTPVYSSHRLHSTIETASSGVGWRSLFPLALSLLTLSRRL